MNHEISDGPPHLGFSSILSKCVDLQDARLDGMVLFWIDVFVLVGRCTVHEMETIANTKHDVLGILVRDDLVSIALRRSLQGMRVIRELRGDYSEQ